ncbi:hypothetical protein Q8A73_009142 [Channa argus]|nr:hypothetical protein Q8A73_009142 [Channa argus]
MRVSGDCWKVRVRASPRPPLFVPPPVVGGALSIWPRTLLRNAKQVHDFPENIFRRSSLIESMPDTGTAAAAAAGGATTAGDGLESSRHRHRTQQGDAERPEPGAAPPQSSGVLGESTVPLCLWTMRFRKGAGECDAGKRRVTVLLSPRGRPRITD